MNSPGAEGQFVLGNNGSVGSRKTAIKLVIEFIEPDNGSVDDQIFVQPMLDHVSMAGVAFSRSPSGGPYFIINYDDRSGLTDRVTTGLGDNLETFLCLKSRPDACPPSLGPVIALVRELETLLGCDAIDVEFAVGGDGQLYLLQVRPLAVDRQDRAADAMVDSALADVARKVELLSRPHPYLHGSRAIFGVMPDWNPAEIVGVRPWPLSLSLYRELITDAIWAYQRDNYGYQNLRSFPLLVSFQGLPYIDVRVSFNSFIPRGVPDSLAARLVNYYIDRLLSEPHLHDKVEFEIIFSCYTLDLPKRMSSLAERGFSPEDILLNSRRSTAPCTNRIMHGEVCCGGDDRAKIDAPVQRLPAILQLEDRQDQSHLLADRGLQAIWHAAVRRSSPGGLHSSSAAAVLGRGRRSQCRRACNIYSECRYRRFAHRARFRATSEGRVPRALWPPPTRDLRHPVAALRRGA